MLMKRRHSAAEVRRVIAKALGLELELVHLNPEAKTDAPVRALLDTANEGAYSMSLLVAIVDPAIAPTAHNDIDIAVPIARALMDDVVCDPTGVTSAGAHPSPGLWAVIDAQGVVRLAREVEADDEDVFDLEIDPTPVEI